LGEALVKQPGAGAIAVWASSGLTPPLNQFKMNEKIISLIYEHGVTRLGDLVKQTKTHMIGQPGSEDHLKTWVLLGDPAMKLHTNSRPVAKTKALVQSHVQSGSSIMLDGSASYDEDNDSITYQWQVISAPLIGNYSFINGNQPQAGFIPGAPGMYELALTVNDGQFNSELSRVQILALGESSGGCSLAPNRQAGAGSMMTFLIMLLPLLLLALRKKYKSY